MGVVRDVTVEQLTQAIGGIDTSGLAKDTTLQATNTALGNINTTLRGITTNDPPTDTTQQSIASAISGLGQTLGSDRALIDGSNIGDKATFRQNIGLATGTPTITPASGVTIVNNSTYKIGNIVGGSLNMEVTASVGTYETIGTISPAPNSSIRVPITRVANGSYAGLILIFAQTGQMQILANQALSGNGVSFTFSYTS